jgi:hypothetical protein
MTGTQHVGTLKHQFLQYTPIKNVLVLFHYQNNFEMNYSFAVWWQHLPSACNNFFEAGVSGNWCRTKLEFVSIILSGLSFQKRICVRRNADETRAGLTAEEEGTVSTPNGSEIDSFGHLWPGADPESLPFHCKLKGYRSGVENPI